MHESMKRAWNSQLQAASEATGVARFSHFAIKKLHSWWNGEGKAAVKGNKWTKKKFNVESRVAIFDSCAVCIIIEQRTNGKSHDEQLEWTRRKIAKMSWTKRDEYINFMFSELRLFFSSSHPLLTITDEFEKSVASEILKERVRVGARLSLCRIKFKKIL